MIPLDLQPKPEGIRFEPDEHRYFHEPEGEEWPGVTYTLERAGFIDWSMVPPAVLENARERGQHVHTALHFLDDGELDETTLDPEIHGYVMAYLRAKRTLDLEILAVEQIVWSKVHRYAGRLDRLVTLPRKDGGRDKAVVDFKTGIALPAFRLQLAAYVGPLPDARSYRRITLQLSEDGEFKVHEYPGEELQRDLAIFQGAVAAEWWKRTYKV